MKGVGQGASKRIYILFVERMRYTRFGAGSSVPRRSCINREKAREQRGRAPRRVSNGTARSKRPPIFEDRADVCPTYSLSALLTLLLVLPLAPSAARTPPFFSPRTLFIPFRLLLFISLRLADAQLSPLSSVRRFFFSLILQFGKPLPRIIVYLPTVLANAPLSSPEKTCVPRIYCCRGTRLHVAIVPRDGQPLADSLAQLLINRTAIG